jgi:hypothetical protein
MIELRSYRRVFDLERRVYSIDRLRLNPGGVPIRGLIYFLILLAIDLIAGRLPLIRSVVALAPWFVRDLLLPGAAATLLSVIRVEGRAFHAAAYSVLRFRLGPRRLAGFRGCASIGGRWYPPDILMLPDGSEAELRRLRYTGPGAVRVAFENERGGSASASGRSGRMLGLLSPALTLRRTSGGSLDGAEVIALAPGVRLLIRPDDAGVG